MVIYQTLLVIRYCIYCFNSLLWFRDIQPQINKIKWPHVNKIGRIKMKYGRKLIPIMSAYKSDNFLNIMAANNSKLVFVYKDHSNNTWHFFDPLPYVTFYFFNNFFLRLLGTELWNDTKVSFNALSKVTYYSKSLKIRVLKGKKRLCDTLS